MQESRRWPGLSGRRLAACALVAWSFAGPALAGARLEGHWIVIEGAGNTLETVAKDLATSAILSYDPETGYAVSARPLRIAGALAVGGPATTGSLFRYVANLEFDVGQCGQARIVLAPAGDTKPSLVVENARIATLRTDEGNDACNAEGNLIEVGAGRLALHSATVTGNFVVRVNGGAVEVVDSTLTTSNHAGLSLSGVRGSQTRIAGLRVLDHKLYGMEVGPLDGPVTLERCAIRGGGADLHVRGPTEVIARDCDFDSIRFAGTDGRVRRQWTVTVRTPSAGCRVVAESERGAGVPERVEATADSSGTARLVLTEYVARPGGLDYLRRGKNDSTPHRLTVTAPDGQTVVGQLKNYRVLTLGQEVRIP